MARNYAGERGRLLDILILQILEGGMDFARIAALKKDNLEALTPEGRDIATRNCAAERRYVFALRQSERTPRQMYAYLEKRMELLLADIGLRPSMHIEDTAKNIWIRLALETGADVSAVATEAGTIPPDNPYLRFAVPTHNHDPFGIRQQVSASLLDNPMHWYALRMRPGRRMSQLLETGPRAVLGRLRGGGSHARRCAVPAANHEFLLWSANQPVVAGHSLAALGVDRFRPDSPGVRSPIMQLRRCDG